MPADVREAFLDDAEDLDLLVRAEAHAGVDLEVDRELAVGDEEVDVAAKGGVERSVTRRRRERQDRELRLLLRRRGGELELRQRRRRIGTRLEHARVRRDGEEVLRDAVVDLARDARALLRHRAAELGLEDRPPDPDHEYRVGQQRQEVGLRDLVAAEQGPEDQAQRREEHQRRAEREPAVEVLTTRAEAKPEADDGDQDQERLQSKRHGQQRGRVRGGHRCELREARPRCSREQPAADDGRRQDEQRVSERELTCPHAAPERRSGGDESPADEPTAHIRPTLAAAHRRPVESRRDREQQHRRGDGEEAGGEQQVDSTPFDGEPRRRQDRDEGAAEENGRVEDEPERRQPLRRQQVGIRREEREARPQQREQQDLPDEPGLVRACLASPHVSLVGSRRAADKALMARVLIVDDHPLTRSALGSLLGANGFDVVGEAADGHEAIGAARELQPDLVLLDLTMPELDGIAALPQLRAAAPACDVVVLTASESDDNLLDSIRAGAAGYLLKSEPPDRIVGFLRGVANGEAALSGLAARRLLEQVRDGGRGERVPDAVAQALSARELEVLLLLDEHLGTEQIAKRLYISEHTVRSHVKSLLGKLKVSSRREALELLNARR